MKPDFVFEISWEAANRVGGIHTVIASKAREMVAHYGADYFLVGPYFKDKLSGQFEPLLPPEYFKKAFSEVEKEGVRVHFGKWLIDGEPFIILLEFDGVKPYLDDIKKELWNLHQVDSLGSGFDFDEPIVWGYAVGKMIKLIADDLSDKKILCHFHEWLTGSAFVYLKKEKVSFTSVFTTHATTLGRSLAGRGVDFYNNFESINADAEARANSVQHKHQLEKAIALGVDAFTTVSQITALEAKHFLGRDPDLILPNGLDIEKFPTIEDITRKHNIQRNRIRKFLIYYFFPYYNFDISQTIVFYTAARYEFRNKGVDVYIQALARLNEKLKKEKSKKTVVSFFWIPANVSCINKTLLKFREIFNDIQNSLEEVEEEMEDAILYSLISQHDIKVSELLDSQLVLSLKSKIRAMKSENALPPLATHDLVDGYDPIIKAFKDAGLTNKEEDRVKVIFYPIYSSGSDGLLNLEFYESIQGSHFGVFPSFYEPWGYTPLESAALGVSSVTTDLSGFGRYFKPELAGQENPGVYIVERFGKSDEETIGSLTDILHRYALLSRRERVDNKIAAYKLAARADWSIFVKNYFKAHEKALAKYLTSDI